MLGATRFRGAVPSLVPFLPALINSAGILSNPGDLKFLNFFINISTSIPLGLGIHVSAV